MSDSRDPQRQKLLDALALVRADSETASAHLRSVVHQVDALFREGLEVEGTSRSASRRALLRAALKEAQAELAKYRAQFDGDLTPDEGQAAFDMAAECGHDLTWVQRDRVCREIRRRRLP